MRFCVGWISGLGVINNSKGAVSFTSTRTVTGQYTLAFASAHPDGSSYIVHITPKRMDVTGDAQDIEATYETTTATALLVQTGKQDDGADPGTLVDNDCCFIVL